MAARILVADDSVTIQKVVELTFSKEDFVLIQARSGEEAIRKAKEERPDLVLLDLVMPDKNGYEVCAALRAEPALRGVPIILLTGTFEPFDKDKGIQAGASDFVTKPFESQSLIGKVKQLLFAKRVDVAAAAPVTPPPRITPRPSPAPGAGPGMVPGPARAAAPGVAAPPPGPAARPPLRPATPPARAAAPVPPPPRPSPAVGAAPPARPAPEKPAAAPGAPRAGRTLDLSPPTGEITQDRMWEAVESAPPPAPPPPPGGFGDLTLEDLGTLPVPGRPEEPHRDPEPAAAAPKPVPEGLPSLEVPSFELEPVETQGGAPAREVGTGGLPESLSLEDLLSGGPATPPPAAAPAPVEEPSGGPVFDLTSEMEAASLPLTQVGAGEPPSLSIEDLLASTGAAPPAPGAAGIPELELEPMPGAAAEGAEVAPTPLDIEPLVEAPLMESQGIMLEPILAMPEAQVAPAETPSPVSAVEEVQAPMAEAAAVGEERVGTVGEMAAIRQAVTERVAHELTRDLSDKLLERIEQIVWEVVPDLAEILIAKEIERIRALAEGKQPS